MGWRRQHKTSVEEDFSVSSHLETAAGSIDCDIKAQVLSIVAGKWDQEISRSSVEARKEEQRLPSWVEASRLGKPDEALSKSIVLGDCLPTCSTDKGTITPAICRVVAGRTLP